MDAIQAIQQRKAFYYEARERCERYDIPIEELENVRLSMAVRELRRRMERWERTLAELLPSMYSANPNAPIPKSYFDLWAQVDELRRREMKDLGIEPTEATPAKGRCF